MKHKKDWSTIAEAFLTPFEEQTSFQQSLTQNGLCFARYWIQGSDPGVSDAICKIKPNANCGNFWLPIKMSRKFKPENDLIRGDMATLFSVMSLTDYYKVLNLK